MAKRGRMTRSLPEWIGKTPDTKVPPRVIARLALKQNGRCACGCNRKFGVKDRPEADHILALVNGGENREGNLQLLTVHCHRKKTRQDVKIKAKVARTHKRHLGIKPVSCGWNKDLRKHVDGRVTNRATGEQVWPR